jgi:hypothetical protein
MRQGSPWQPERIEGDPIQVGQRQLIPVVKVRSLVRRKVTFGTQQSSGQGGGLVWLRPVEVIERRSDGTEEHAPIADETGARIERMLIGALALPILDLLIASVMFLWHRRRTER